MTGYRPEFEAAARMFSKRAWEIMVSTSSDKEVWPGRTISYPAFAQELELRRKSVKFTEDADLRNAGTHRTPSKLALLESIELLARNK